MSADTDTRNQDLPEGWEWKTLGDVGRYHNGRAFKTSEWADSGRPIIRIQNLTDSAKSFNYFQGSADERHVVRRSDTLVSWAATLGVFQWEGDEAVLNQHIFKVDSDLDVAFHRWAMRAVLGSLMAKTRGSGMVHITRGDFLRQRIPVPPLDEQRAIVAAIEGAFARIDVIAAELRAVHTSRDSFKAAVLRDAFSGALSSQLPAGGGMSADTDTRDQDLPEGWEWKRLGDVVEVKSGVGFPKHLQGRSAGDVPFAKVSDLSTACREHNGRLVVANNLISEDEVRQLRAPILPAGAVVMAKIGEAVKLNRRAILSREMTIDNNVMAWIPNTALLIPNYLYCWSLGVRLEDLARATTVPSVRKSSVVELQIPVPPLDEQRAIIAAIEDAFARIDAIEAEATKAEAGMVALRASVLHRAFTGELSVAHTSEKEGVA